MPSNGTAENVVLSSLVKVPAMGSWSLFWKGSSLLGFQLCLVVLVFWGGRFPAAVGSGGCWAPQQFGDLMNEVKKWGFCAAPT